MRSRYTLIHNFISFFLSVWHCRLQHLKCDTESCIALGAYTIYVTLKRTMCPLFAKWISKYWRSCNHVGDHPYGGLGMEFRSLIIFLQELKIKQKTNFVFLGPVHDNAIELSYIICLKLNKSENLIFCFIFFCFRNISF